MPVINTRTTTNATDFTEYNKTFWNTDSTLRKKSKLHLRNDFYIIRKITCKTSLQFPKFKNQQESTRGQHEYCVWKRLWASVRDILSKLLIIIIWKENIAIQSELRDISDIKWIKWYDEIIMSVLFTFRSYADFSFQRVQ